MNINYKITLHSYWHCGSGLAAGAQADSLVIKDKNGLPYIPGKTIKGLIRDAVDELLSFDGITEPDEAYQKVFGYFGDDKKDNDKKDENEKEKEKVAIKSEAFFSNATLNETESKAITEHNLQQFMFKNIASTSIEENGIAKDHSLRTTQVTVPCTLEGEIIDVPDGMKETIENAMKFIKQLGSGRTRGLGRCTFELKERSDA